MSELEKSTSTLEPFTNIKADYLIFIVTDKDITWHVQRLGGVC